MSFQGKEFSSEITQMIVNLKLHFDSEKKTGKFVSTQNAIKRVATGLGIGEITVKRIMADYNKGKIKERKIRDRGKPPYKMSDNLQPVVRECVRKKNLKGRKITAEEIREFCRQQLAPYAVPKYFEFRDQMPLTVTEKVFKKVLREEAVQKMKDGGE